MSDTMKTKISRRAMIGATIGGAAMLHARPGFAAAKTLNVLSHKVHQTVLGSGDGDLLKDWRKANDCEIEFTTFDSNPLQDRLFREASLQETNYGVGYLIDNRPTSQIAALFEPLQPHQAQNPIEDFGDIAPGLVQGMTVDGKLIGIPVRHATQGLFYNEALLEEAGIKAPPTTLEELVEQAKKTTFTSKAGAPVVGMVLASDLAVFPVMFARAFGGDFISGDFKLVPDRAAMESGLNTLRGMFEAGSLPRSYATTKNDDQVTWLQQGRAAFTILPFARAAQLNNAEQSRTVLTLLAASAFVTPVRVTRSWLNGRKGWPMCLVDKGFGQRWTIILPLPRCSYMPVLWMISIYCRLRPSHEWSPTA